MDSGADRHLGADNDYPEEGPAREVTVDGFWMQTHQVTNAQFAEFVDATGYVTVAERPLNPDDYPGAPPENLQPGSMVFHRTPGPVDLRHINQWWTWTPGACWNHPRGPRSSLRSRENHPVVHVAFEDAAAYADWAGRALPTEAEWESRPAAGSTARPTPGATTPNSPVSGWRTTGTANFPYLPDTGYGTTAPVGSFPPNGYGLFDMAGNVWEWTTDWYGDTRDTRVAPRTATTRKQPQFQIPPQGDQGRLVSVRRQLLPALPARRAPTADVDTGMSHIGFRCVER